MHKLIPTAQAMKIPDATVAVDKEWARLEKLPAWQLTKVKSKKGGHRKGIKKREGQFILRRLWTCHLKNSELEQKVQKYKGRVVLRGDLVKDDAGRFSCCLLGIRVFKVTNDGRKNFGHCCQPTWKAQNTRATQSQLHPSQKWRTFRHCSSFLKSE